MRLRSIALRGLTRFTAAAPVSVDLDALGPGLVALIGQNGAGKTTCLEAVAAALYKRLPSRPGSLYDHAHGRDAFVEVAFDDVGRDLKVRVQIDAEGRKAESYLFEDGRTLTTGRAAEFETEVLRRFGSESLFLSSAFAAQNKAGNFLLLPKAERKALFVELLGLGHLEILCQGARDRRARAELELAGARETLRCAQEEATGLADAERVAAEAQGVADAAAHELEGAREEEASAIAALERARSAGEKLLQLQRAVEAAAQAVADAERALQDSKTSEQTAEREAERRRAALEAQDPEAIEERATRRHAEALAGIARRRETLEKALAERPALELARDQVSTLEAERAQLDAAEKAHATALAELRLAEAADDAAQRRMKDAEQRLIDEQERLAGEAKLLEKVPCTERDSWSYQDRVGNTTRRALAQNCPLLAAARLAKDRGPTLAIDRAIVEALDSAEVAYGTANDREETAQAATDPIRLAEIVAALPALREQAARLSRLDDVEEQLGALAGERKRADEQQAQDLQAAADLRTRLEAQRARIDLDLTAARSQARDRIAQAEEHLAAAREKATDAGTRLHEAKEGLGALSIPAADASLSGARQVRIEAERRLRDADKALAGAGERVAMLRERAEGIPVREQQVRRDEQEVGDWALLERALGRDGVQALEIDAAGPEVAHLTNELLEACYGARFSLTFETLREKRSARGEFAEAFDVRVFDRGHERPVEALSGGERVVVGEALGLAIAIFNARKSGIRWETLFRDETAGALDQDNARAYVDMLRRALGLGGFAQVLFVSHSEQVWERADARLLVADGRVTVEGSKPALARATAEVA